MADPPAAAAVVGQAVIASRKAVALQAKQPEGQVLVPGKDSPQLRALGVAVEKVILEGAVHVLDEHAGREVVDQGGQVEVVLHKCAAIGISGAESGDEFLQVGVSLRPPRSLLDAAGGGHEAIVHFIHRAVGIEAATLQIRLVHLFHEHRHAEEGVVLLHAHIEGVAGGRTGLTIRLEGQWCAHIRLVVVSGVQVQLVRPRLPRLETEVIARVEVELVRLLREVRSGRPANPVEDIVIKLAIPIDRCTGAGGGVGGGHVLHEPVEDRERVGQDGIDDHGAEVGR